MALLNGKATFVQFKAEYPQDVLPGINHELSEEFITDRIKANRFNDIDDTFDDWSIGWVSIADYLDAEFTTMHPTIGGSLVMSLRYDERKVPAPILDKCFGKKCKEVMEEKGLPKLARAMKADIKLMVKTELLRKTTPAPTVIDVLFDTTTMQGIFFSTNRVAFTLFEDLFLQTYGLIVSQQVPYTIGRSSICDEIVNIMYPHLQAENTALVDIIEATRELGQEFLLWLWWYSEANEMVPLTYEDGVTYVTIGNNIVLQTENEKITCTGIDSDLTEAKLGVAEGKKVDQVGFKISYDDHTYAGTMNAMFEFKGVATPKVIDSDDGEEDGGLVLARAFQFTHFTGIVKKLFTRYLSERGNSDVWERRKGQIVEWAEGVNI